MTDISYLWPPIQIFLFQTEVIFLAAAPGTINHGSNTQLVIGWVPAIRSPGRLSRLRAKVMGWEDRASRGTSEGPGRDAGCPEPRGYRVGGSSTTPWWSVPGSSGRSGRRRRRTPAGSPIRTCLRWRRRRTHGQRPDLRRGGTTTVNTWQPVKQIWILILINWWLTDYEVNTWWLEVTVSTVHWKRDGSSLMDKKSDTNRSKNRRELMSRHLEVFQCHIKICSPLNMCSLTTMTWDDSKLTYSLLDH